MLVRNDFDDFDLSESYEEYNNEMLECFEEFNYSAEEFFEKLIEDIDI